MSLTNKLKKIKEKVRPKGDAEKAVYGGFASVPALMGETALHELGHYAPAKALGYDAALDVTIKDGFIYATNTILDLQPGLDSLLTAAGGPVVSNLLVLLSALAFRKAKNPYVKGATGAYALAGGFNNSLNAIIGPDYNVMADAIEDIGFGRVGDILPIIPATLALACSYFILKDWKKYHKREEQKTIANLRDETEEE